MRSLHRAAVASLAAVSFLGAACEETASESQGGRALDLVPANAAVYFEIAVEPSESQQAALDELARRLPREVRDELPNELPAEVEETMQELGLDFGRAFPVEFDEIEGWLGRSIAGFVVTEVVDDFSVTLFAVEGSPEDAVATFEETMTDTSKESYRGLDYVSGSAFNGSIAEVGIVDDFLVVADEGGFEATVDASVEDTLATVPEFEQATSAVAGDALATFYVDVDSLRNEPTLEDQITREEFRSAGLYGNGVVAVTLSARENALVVEASSGLDKGGLLEPVLRGYTKGDTLDEVPGDAWLAARAPNVRALVKAVMRLSGTRQQPGWRAFKRELKRADLRFGKDVLSWMRDAKIYVSGESLPFLGGGLLIDSTDPRRTAEFTRLLSFLLRGGGVRVSRLPSVATMADFKLHVPSLPRPLLVSGARQFAVTYGRPLNEALREEGFLDDADDFAEAREALGEGFGPTLFVDVGAARGLVEGTVELTSGALPRPYREDVKPFLEQADYVMHGVAVEDDRILQKIVIGVR